MSTAGVRSSLEKGSSAYPEECKGKSYVFVERVYTELDRGMNLGSDDPQSISFDSL